MRFLIIGLGIYGSNLAIDLTNMGHEVIGADSNPSLVDSIKDLISTAYIIDATDKAALSALPLTNVDLVIVAIGENFGASIRIVALLKQLNVPHIYARAIDRIHESILQSFEIDRILTPEQRAASDLVHEMSLGADVTTMRLDSDNYILRFAAPSRFIGLAYSSLPLPAGLKLLEAVRPTSERNALGLRHMRPRLITSLESESVAEGDLLVVQGTPDAYRSFIRSLE